MKSITLPGRLRLTAALILVGYLALPLSGQTQAAQERDLSKELAVLKSLGFHVFPTPVEIDPFTVPALTGGTTDSQNLKGKIVLLNFWATWCPPCKREMPSIETLWKTLKGEAFTIAAISTGEKRKTVEDFIAQNRYTFPIFLDEGGSMGRIYATQGIPTTYVLDKQGRIIAGIVGSTEYDNPELIKALRAMAAK